MSVITPSEALSILAKDSVVALPTETVYGLAGRIHSEEALRLIFKTKARPFFDPLIVHVTGLKQALNYGDWDPLSEHLAKTFWPGPLTIIVKKKKNISSLITSGGITVAFRAPDHPNFQEILSKVNGPLAAPSANRFGKTSPVSAQHVINEFQSQVPVVDGGFCQKGIESTVIEVDWEGQEVFILRPGVITDQDLASQIDTKSFPFRVSYKKQINSPGHLKHHYQPEYPLTLAMGWTKQNQLDELVAELEKKSNTPVHLWHLPKEPLLAARSLYAELRTQSKPDIISVLAFNEDASLEPLWRALEDRIKKAASREAHWDGSQWSHHEKEPDPNRASSDDPSHQ
ncbi:MAG: L-threonylcarbamoyladenylate synthase [Pseudomonadota bacterium]